MLWPYWYNFQIPAVLKKHKADILIAANGIASLKTRVPQLLLIHEFSFLQNPGFLKKSQLRFYKKFTGEFLRKAKNIVTFTGFSKDIIANNFKTAGNVDVINPGIRDNFKPLAPAQKDLIKESYTEGKEYFLSTESNNLINLLKAFSFFKKRQKSNMMLLITGQTDEEFMKALQNYKFRNEVRLFHNLTDKEFSNILAAAYAVVNPVLYSSFTNVPLQAMQCEVPVVTSTTGILPSLCHNAALYVNPRDFEDIAEKMMLVYKDEEKTKVLVKAGTSLLAQHLPDDYDEQIWQCILKTIND